MRHAGGANTSYQLLSGGREYYCSDCESEFPYRDDERPPRLQLMVDGRWDELRADMEEHFRRRKIIRRRAMSREADEEALVAALAPMTYNGVVDDVLGDVIQAVLGAGFHRDCGAGQVVSGQVSGRVVQTRDTGSITFN